MVRLPSTTFPDVDGDIFTEGEENEYEASEMGSTEVRLGSAGRSWIIGPGTINK
jgi:hypothetical protein